MFDSVLNGPTPRVNVNYKTAAKLGKSGKSVNRNIYQGQTEKLAKFVICRESGGVGVSSCIDEKGLVLII